MYNKQEQTNVMKKWLHQALNKGIAGIENEYLKTRKHVSAEKTSAFKENCSKSKNRSNIYGCLDATRVILKNHSTDYINASYVSTVASPQRFIIAQAPMDNTIEDFWKMIIQEEVETVVMLCNFYEKRRSKCAEYYPVSEDTFKVIDKYEIYNYHTNEVIMGKDKYTKSELIVEDRVWNRRTIEHYKWTEWPDAEVPKSTNVVLSLLNITRGSKKPIIVHCSTGLGRAGTFVGIAILLDSFHYGVKVYMDTFLSSLRKQRAYAVGTSLQYLYLHKAVIDFLTQNNVIAASDLSLIEKFDNDYRSKFATVPTLNKQ